MTGSWKARVGTRTGAFSLLPGHAHWIPVMRPRADATQ